MDTKERLDRLMRDWNYMVAVVHTRDNVKLPRVMAIGKGMRARMAKQRVEDDEWWGQYRKALNVIAKSNFCKGKNDWGWVANFQWFVRPDTVLLCLEGKYDNRDADQRVKPGAE